MSLPARAVFYKGDTKISSEFVNCGWSDDDTSVARCLVELADENRYPKDWDMVVLYGRNFTILQVEAIIAVMRAEKWFNVAKRTAYGRGALASMMERLAT